MMLAAKGGGKSADFWFSSDKGVGGLGDFSVVKYSSRSQENFTAHKPEPHKTLKNYFFVNI